MKPNIKSTIGCSTIKSSRCIIVIICRNPLYNLIPCLFHLHLHVLARNRLFFFFFLFAYTTRPAAVMKLVVLFRSSKPPYNCWWSEVADGHCATRSGWCLLHLWSNRLTYSVYTLTVYSRMVSSEIWRFDEDTVVDHIVWPEDHVLMLHSRDFSRRPIGSDSSSIRNPRTRIRAASRKNLTSRHWQYFQAPVHTIFDLVFFCLFFHVSTEAHEAVPTVICVAVVPTYGRPM